MKNLNNIKELRKENEKLNEVIESLHRQVKFHKAQSTEHFNNLQTKEQALYNLENKIQTLKDFIIRTNQDTPDKIWWTKNI
jgi:predicted  nucleic acid-binding Zn-ribbon protein